MSNKPKKRKKKPQQPAKTPNKPGGEAAVQIEETFEHATDAVRTFFTQYRVPMIVVLCAVIVIFAAMSWSRSALADKVLGWNAEFYKAMNSDGDDEAKKTKLAEVVQNHMDEPCGAWMAVRYAGWLLETDPVANRQRAMEVIQEASTKHPDNGLLNVVSARYQEVAAADSGFEVPPPPPEPEQPAGQPANVPEGFQRNPDGSFTAPGGGTFTPLKPGDPRIPGAAKPEGDAADGGAAADDAPAGDAPSDDTTDDGDKPGTKLKVLPDGTVVQPGAEPKPDDAPEPDAPTSQPAGGG